MRSRFSSTALLLNVSLLACALSACSSGSSSSRGGATVAPPASSAPTFRTLDQGPQTGVAVATSGVSFQRAAEEEIPVEERWTRRQQLVSYVPSAVVMLVLLGCAAAVAWSGPASATALAAIALANAGLVVQLLTLRKYWYRDLGLG